MMDEPAKTKREVTFSRLLGFRELGIIIFIVLISVLIGIRNPRFLTWSNFHDILIDTAALSVLSVGMMLVLVTGGIDLSMESVLALTGMVAGMMVKQNPQLSPLFMLILGLLLGGLLGSITGLIVAKGRVVPIIATLSMMYIYRGITFIISGGKWINAYEMPDSFKGIATERFLGLSKLIYIVLVVYVVFYYFVNYTHTGRKIYAVGSNVEAARVIGINTEFITWLVYAISGALSGLAGVMWVARYASAQNDTASGFVMTIVAACVLGGVSITGGVGTVSGVLLGSITVGIINNALPMIRVSPFWKMALQGLIILVAAIVNIAIARNMEKSQLKRRTI
ncbi:ABC transporter permease [Candidatus Sordicultor fermentans]|jgi:rhamnose transport system permease protein|uniref:ABC transporter permease n=1 Tax=Candidatus Sordicultor fermentans TaxID=1953203 RepID=UPI002A27BDFB|nr:ABC transporter permease [Atribacterota bacterium]MDY0135202.1 ABC transporter permease [Atribacterota bacterium]HPZ39838.1 ABC transporter permease [Candidatus Atribacteria bacterium]HQD33424.1 ABC transporter permease [Candidatus Atribacteria bacterium]